MLVIFRLLCGKLGGLYRTAGNARSGSGAIGAGNDAHSLPSARLRAGLAGVVEGDSDLTLCGNTSLISLPSFDSPLS